MRVNRAIREEFLEKGYEGASVRSIGARAGMTSAGLYRHYADKASMFESIVAPLIEEIKAWTVRHKKRKYELADGTVDKSILFGETFIDLIREVILPRKDEFKILMKCSAGTKYESFVHDYILENQASIMQAKDHLASLGYKVRNINEAELHMLLSAYLTACFQPIIHDYDDTQLDRYLNTVQEFFMPGWLMVMGVN